MRAGPGYSPCREGKGRSGVRERGFLAGREKEFPIIPIRPPSELERACRTRINKTVLLKGHYTMALSNLVRKVKRNVEDYGWLFTARASLARLFKPIFEKQLFRIYRIKLEQFKPKARENGIFTFKILEPNDENLICQVESMAEWLEGDLHSRITSGGLCLVALHNSKVAAFNLVAFKEFFISWINLKKAIKPHEAWSEQISVHKEFRNKRLASELRYRVFEELKQRGIKRFYGGTLTLNQPSLKLARKVGFEEIVDIHYQKIFGFTQRRYKRINK